MIVTKIGGGLGNQLFQYAMAKKLALTHKTDVLLDISAYKTYKLHEYSLGHFQIPQHFFTPPSKLKKIWNLFRQNNKYFPFVLCLEKKATFDPSILDSPDNIYMHGYWGSEKYFKDIRRELLSDLDLKEPLSQHENELCLKIKSVNAVCVHVRRGNFVNNPQTAATHGTCSIEYYQDAVKKMQAILNNPVFYVFSNDIAWAKENLSFIDPVFFIGGDESSNYKDFHLMRSCKHFIIANSTFSWWAAWSSDNPDKQVIAPKKWFANPQISAEPMPLEWITL